MDVAGVEAPPPVQEQLSPRAPLAIDTLASRAEIDARSVQIEGGQVRVRAIGERLIELSGIDLDVAPVIVQGEDKHLDGLVLRNIKVSLADPVVAPVEWTIAGDAGFATLTVDLLLDWDLVTPNGGELELATQRFTSVQVELDLFTAEDGSLTAVLYGGKDGLIWQWAGLVELRDLSFDVRATR